MDAIKHTQGKWETDFVHGVGDLVRSYTGDDLLLIARVLRPEDAEFIVRACNSHYDLVKALEETQAVLEEVYETACNNPTKSTAKHCQITSMANRNFIAKEIVRKAITKAEGK